MSFNSVVLILILFSIILCVLMADNGVFGSSELLRNQTESRNSNTTNLSNTPITVIGNGLSLSPDIFALGSEVYTVWADNYLGNDDIFFRRSTDGGITFDKTINVSNNSGSSSQPRIAAWGNNVYIVWYDDTTDQQNDILFSRSTDGGMTFEPTKRVDNNTGDSSNPRITVRSDNVFITWDSLTSGDAVKGTSEIFFRRSTDGGVTFDKTINVSDKIRVVSREPLISVFENSVYVVWNGGFSESRKEFPFDIFFRRSTDGGATFDETINVSDNLGDSMEPTLETAFDNIYVAWTEDNDIFFRRSTDGGATFDETINVSNSSALGENNITSASSPQAAISSNNLYIIGSEEQINDYTNPNLFFVKSVDGGVTFDGSIDLDENVSYVYDPQILLSGNGDVYITWNDWVQITEQPTYYEENTRTKSDIFLIKSHDAGNTFDKVINITNTGNASNPLLTGAEKNVYLLWEQGGEILLQEVSSLSHDSYNSFNDRRENVTADFENKKRRESLFSNEFGSPVVIDGDIGTGEWLAAKKTELETEINGNKFQLVFLPLMDNTSMYIMAAVQGKNFNGGSTIFYLFDNDRDGNLNLDDDMLGVLRPNNSRQHTSFVDGYWDNVTNLYRDDLRGNGTKDGDAAVSFANGTEIFELRHPLCSGDQRDFCISSENPFIGFSVVLGFEDNYTVLFYDPHTEKMADLGEELGHLEPRNYYTPTPYIEIMPSVYNAFKRMDVEQRLFFLANFSRDERSRLLNSPTPEDVESYLLRIDSKKLLKFLDGLYQIELLETLESPDPENLLKLLYSIPDNYRSSILCRLDPEQLSYVFKNPTSYHIANFVNTSLGKGIPYSNLGLYQPNDHCEKVPTLDPNSAEVYLNTGLYLLNARRYYEAIENFEIVLDLDRNNKDALYHKGLALGSLRHYNESISIFNHILSIYPNDTEAMNAKAFDLSLSHKNEEALLVIDPAIKAKPDDPYIVSTYAFILYNLGKYDDARNQYARAFELEPDLLLELHPDERNAYDRLRSLNSSLSN